MPTALKRFLRITPQQLRAFEATARLLSMTQAAKELHVTQPTISVQLRELADKVGEPLFEIADGSLKLTPVGELLVQTQGGIGNLWMQFENQLDSLRGETKLHLHVCAQTGAERFLPPRLISFELANPEVELEFTLCSFEVALDKLANGVCELAVFATAPDQTTFECQPLHTVAQVVIAPVHHRLANAADPVDITELQRDRWLLLGDTAPLPGLHAVRHMRLDSYEAICKSATAGLGVAMVPADEALQSNHAGVVVLKIHGFPKLQAWSFVWKKHRPLSPSARSFMASFSQLPAPDPG